MMPPTESWWLDTQRFYQRAQTEALRMRGAQLPRDLEQLKREEHWTEHHPAIASHQRLKADDRRGRP